jgi:luciferase-type oxidoreductase
MDLRPDRPAVHDLPGFRAVFAPDRLTLGLLCPIEAYTGARPRMLHQERLARAAESAGFAALWVRDVPLRVPKFGDLGQIYDPWVYLGWIASRTSRIALGTASIVLPLRHPLHTAKAAASVDRLSDGRLLLGVASGDRPQEYPAFGKPFERRPEDFREHLRVLRRVLHEEFPVIDSTFGELRGVDLLPKPVGRELPVLVTGHSGQSLTWIAAEAHGWLTYPRPLVRQRQVIAEWRAAVEAIAPGTFKPFAQSLYIDLAAEPHHPPQPIHLGWRLGRVALEELLEELQTAGANHVILNLKYGLRPAGEVIEELAEQLLPRFPAIAPAPGVELPATHSAGVG